MHHASEAFANIVEPLEQYDNIPLASIGNQMEACTMALTAGTAEHPVADIFAFLWYSILTLICPRCGPAQENYSPTTGKSMAHSRKLRWSRNDELGSELFYSRQASRTRDETKMRNGRMHLTAQYSKVLYTSYIRIVLTVWKWSLSPINAT